MKKLLLLVAIAAALTVGLYAAQAYSRSTYRMVFFGVNPTYTNGSNNPTTVDCQAVFKRRYTNDTDANDNEESSKQLSVSFDLMSAPNTQTTVNAPGNGGSVTITDAQGALWLRKRSEQAGGL